MPMPPSPRPGEALRLAPDLPLPPYAFIPGGPFPHPRSDPRGHSHGAEYRPPEAPDLDDWQSCLPYLYGIDLFNHGYYWEAHEAWEGLWHACGRCGRTAAFLKGLIKLAAAGVKIREGKPQGVSNHAQRAADLFRQTALELGSEGVAYMGLRLCDLTRLAGKIADRPPANTGGKADPVRVVFDFVLRPA
jgi:hypothetical protein